MRRASSCCHHIDQPGSAVRPHRALGCRGIEVSGQNERRARVGFAPRCNRFGGVTGLGLTPPCVCRAAASLVMHDEQPDASTRGMSQHHLQRRAAKGDGLGAASRLLPATCSGPRPQLNCRLHKGRFDWNSAEHRTLDTAVVPGVN
jgi:hypothetical protein